MATDPAAPPLIVLRILGETRCLPLTRCRRPTLSSIGCSYQKSAALKTAIDLELFTAIDEGARTAAAVAARTKVSERGARILCDYLTVNKLLAKSDGLYQLVPESAAFLSKRSPAYLGTIVDFLLRPELKNNFENLTKPFVGAAWSAR